MLAPIRGVASGRTSARAAGEGLRDASAWDRAGRRACQEERAEWEATRADPLRLEQELSRTRGNFPADLDPKKGHQLSDLGGGVGKPFSI